MPDSPIQQIVCCMGQPVAGNPTQFMMERAFVAADFDSRWLTGGGSGATGKRPMRRMRALGFKGGNITLPHKVAVIPHLDGLREAAQLIGAVRVSIAQGGDKLIGENTEGQGFVQALRARDLDPAGRRKEFIILGAGGAARAIGVELGLSGAAEIVIVNRTAERGQALVDLLNGRVGVVSRLVHLSGDYSGVDAGTQLIVNATSLGTGDGPGPGAVGQGFAALAPEDGGGRRDVQPAADASGPAGGRGPRLPHGRRPRHARQPRGDRLPYLDRGRAGTSHHAQVRWKSIWRSEQSGDGVGAGERDVTQTGQEVARTKGHTHGSEGQFAERVGERPAVAGGDPRGARHARVGWAIERMQARSGWAVPSWSPPTGGRPLGAASPNG